MKILFLLFVLCCINTKVVLRSKSELMKHKQDRKLILFSEESDELNEESKIVDSNNDFVENMKELTSALEDMSGKMQESKRLLLNGFDEALGDLETSHHDLRV